MFNKAWLFFVIIILISLPMAVVSAQEDVSTPEAETSEQPAPVVVQAEDAEWLNPQTIVIFVLCGVIVVALIFLGRSFPSQMQEVVQATLNTLEREARKTSSPYDDLAVKASKELAGKVLQVPIPSGLTEDEVKAATTAALENLIKNKVAPPFQLS